jgi:hypothetical protein
MEGFESIFSSFPFVGIFLTILILVYWVHTFFIMYHLMRFGIGVKPKIFALTFFVGSMLLFMVAVFFYNQVDLSAISLKFDWSMPNINFPTPTF